LLMECAKMNIRGLNIKDKLPAKRNRGINGN
jgi:hypothetical protein